MRPTNYWKNCRVDRKAGLAVSSWTTNGWLLAGCLNPCFFSFFGCAPVSQGENSSRPITFSSDQDNDKRLERGKPRQVFPEEPEGTRIILYLRAAF